MTDKEIVKAMMGCKSQESCDTCALKHSKNCITTFSNAAIDIMTRQKEELKVAKSEAIREFAEKIKVYCNEIVNQEWNKKTSPVSWSDAYEDFIDDIDNLVKGMTEDDNGKTNKSR